MVQEKVTRQELREMQIGKTKIFQLKDAKKCSSARVTCTHMKNEEGLVFECRPDYPKAMVSITRIS